MAGYFEHSKSNNAIDAERNGRFPASVLAKMIGVKPGAIRALLKPTEWHHTSKHFNATDYYSEDQALEIIEDLKAWKPEAKPEEVHEGCTGSFLEWSGTRNHPHAKKISFGPVRAVKRGKWWTLELPTGPVRKGEFTRGFELFRADGKRLTY